MFKQKHILILTSKTGGGHVSLAEALRDLLQQSTNRHEDDGKETATLSITIVDPQPGFFHLHYRFVSRYALWLWAAEFQFFDTPKRALFAHRVFTRLVRRQLSALLDTVQPDLILTTYPFLSSEVMSVLKQRSATVPLVSLFSDANGVHAAWLTERQATATFATTRENYKQALDTGFVPERLHLVGWPVRAQFSRAYLSSQEERAELLARLKLSPQHFTVFLQGGGEGAARIERTIENILAIKTTTREVQIILATGTNRTLYERYKHVHNLAPLPYTKEIASYMVAADVIMGKAGPNMLLEAVTLGKPFIATAYIPGQEEANLPFIQRHGLGWVALHPEEQQALVRTLISDPDQFKAMLRSIDDYRQWNMEANGRIVLLLRSFVPWE